jgi:hypothetical protein
MPRRSTEPCDIDTRQPHLRALLFDAGLEVGTTCYWTVHGKVAFVGKGGGMSKLVLADSPEEAITAAEAAIFGGL